MRRVHFVVSGTLPAIIFSIFLGTLLVALPQQASGKMVKTFRLKHKVSKQYLVPDYTGGRDDKRNVSVEGLYGNRDAYRWYIQTNGTRGRYYIVNLATGLVLTSDGNGNVSTWGRLGEYILSDHPHQVWSMVRNRKTELTPNGDSEFLIYNSASRYYLTQYDGGRRREKHNSTIWKANPDFTRNIIQGFIWEMEDAGDVEISQLTIEKVKCIKPSTGQDAATSVLFNAIEIVAQVGAAAATGGASLAASAAYTGFKAAGRAGAKAALKRVTKKQIIEAAKKSVKKKVRDIPKDLYNQNQREQRKKQAASAADTIAGDGTSEAISDALDLTSVEGVFNKLHGGSPDDLELRVNNVSIWPNGGRDYRKIDSQQVETPKVIFTFPTAKGFGFQLVEYDSASDDDSLGWIVWDKSMGYGRVENQMVVKDDEGSIYEVTYRVMSCGGCYSRRP